MTNRIHKKHIIGITVTLLLILLTYFVVKLPFFDKNPDDVPVAEPPKVTLYVSPNGSDENDGLTEGGAFATIQYALNKARAGTVIQLDDGIYTESIKSYKDGTSNNPIVIKGSRDAQLVAPKNTGRLVEILHDNIHLDGFHINGLNGDTNVKENYADKLVYAVSRDVKEGVSGLQIRNMLIENGGGECIRLRYFAVDNLVENSTIKNCGAFDYIFNQGSKNGEGIYIGTAPEQLDDKKSPSSDIDISMNNIIKNNIIHTNGNECVDIKEGSRDNTIEHNQCSGQRDTESGGFDSRGNENTFRYNLIKDVVGVGIRLGGDSDSDGRDNSIYGNTIRNARSGGIRTIQQEQGRICGNTFEGISSDKYFIGFDNNIENTTCN